MFGGVKFLGKQVLAVARIFCLFMVALFLPKIFLTRIHSSARKIPLRSSSQFRLGIENLSPSFLKKLTPKGDMSFRAGLVTNQTGKDQSGMQTVDILREKGVNVVSLFAPEHGVSGNISAARTVPNAKDKKRNIKIISLYRNGSTKKFDQEILKDIDVLFFDMQDSGMRHYTYITTLFEMLEAASLHKKVAVVLDRPNPLGPYMEGTLVGPSFKSAISYAPIPVRYGMTIGELALYFNKNILKKPAKLHVVQMKNYNRHSYRSHGLLAHLSPNITSMNSCYGYSFLGLLGEIRPFDVGVGTERAFQCILLPENIKFSKKRWHELHLALKKQGVENSFYRYYSARKKRYCSGLRLRVADINRFSSFGTFLMIVDFFKRSGVTLTFSKHFDKAAGSAKVREFLEGKLSRVALTKHINEGLNSFFKKASELNCFLYRPSPKIVNLS